ncbi:MAG: hypothetical protein MMC23_007265 [Stictis urceolatum]|nr:hypothetical protein [Stictis urceolata]
MNSHEAWESYKHLIHKYYIEQRLSLKSTAAIMREKHDFNSTERVYKTKLKQWGVSKYTKKQHQGKSKCNGPARQADEIQGLESNEAPTTPSFINTTNQHERRNGDDEHSFGAYSPFSPLNFDFDYGSQNIEDIFKLSDQAEAAPTFASASAIDVSGVQPADSLIPTSKSTAVPQIDYLPADPDKNTATSQPPHHFQSPKPTRQSFDFHTPKSARQSIDRDHLERLVQQADSLLRELRSVWGGTSAR